MDAGDYLWGRDSVPPNEAAQRKLKAELLAEAAGAKFLNFDAMTPGDGDFAFGLGFLQEQVAKHQLPYVSANLRAHGGDLLFPTFVVVERGGKTIGITGVMSETASISGVDIGPATAAVGAVVKRLREDKKVDLVVVISHLGLTDDKALARLVPEIDMIFGGHSRRHQEQAVIVGQTAIFQAGSRGKTIGEASFFFRGKRGFANPAARIQVERQRSVIEKQVARFEEQLSGDVPEETRVRLARVLSFNKKKLQDLVVPPADDGTGVLIAGRKVDMHRTLPDEPVMQTLVDATLEKLGPALAAEAAEKAKNRPVTKGKKLPGDWVGANACRSCHQVQYDDWRTTPHARAYVTLLKEKRQYDLDCWSCHVTGAEQPGGPQSPTEVGAMRNVQCEACHGPGRKHVSDPTVDMQKTPTEAQCVTCHSEEQTEGRFVYNDYLPKIDHLP